MPSRCALARTQVDDMISKAILALEVARILEERQLTHGSRLVGKGRAVTDISRRDRQSARVGG
jgi:hypothetical protein